MRWRLIVPVLLVTAMVSSATAASDPTAVSKPDGNDTPGPLDLASVVARHDRGQTKFIITTHEAFSDAEVNGDDGLFEVDIDTNADRRANYVVLVFYASGSMRGVLLRPNGDLITRNLRARRVAGAKVSVVVEDNRIGAPESFDFGTFSVWFGRPCSPSDPCVDAIPNRYPLLRLDHTAPTISLALKPRELTDLPVRLALKVVDDRYGVGIDHWTLKVYRSRFPHELTTIEGTKSGSFTRSVSPGGGIWWAKLTAEDKSGNVAKWTEIVPFSVPWDDADPLAEYGGSWTALTDQEGMFGGTVHRGAQGATFTISLKGSERVCILGGPTTGPDATATVQVEGYPEYTATETSTTVPGSTVFCTNGGQWPTLTLTVDTEEPFVLDGVYVTD